MGRGLRALDVGRGLVRRGQLGGALWEGGGWSRGYVLNGSQSGTGAREDSVHPLYAVFLEGERKGGREGGMEGGRKGGGKEGGKDGGRDGGREGEGERGRERGRDGDGKEGGGEEDECVQCDRQRK